MYVVIYICANLNEILLQELLKMYDFRSWSFSHFVELFQNVLYNFRAA
jgi:hypothetical protein